MASSLERIISRTLIPKDYKSLIFSLLIYRLISLGSIAVKPQAMYSEQSISKGRMTAFGFGTRTMKTAVASLLPMEHPTQRERIIRFAYSVPLYSKGISSSTSTNLLPINTRESSQKFAVLRRESPLKGNVLVEVFEPNLFPDYCF